MVKYIVAEAYETVDVRGLVVERIVSPAFDRLDRAKQLVTELENVAFPDMKRKGFQYVDEVTEDCGLKYIVGVYQCGENTHHFRTNHVILTIEVI